MPRMESLAEFNRSQAATLESLKETGQPIYLTRNGRAAAVIMDPDAFERAIGFRERLEREEMSTLEGLLRGYQDIQDGKVMSAEEADRRMREAKGW